MLLCISHYCSAYIWAHADDWFPYKSGITQWKLSESTFCRSLWDVGWVEMSSCDNSGVHDRSRNTCNRQRDLNSCKNRLFCTFRKTHEPRKITASYAMNNKPLNMIRFVLIDDRSSQGEIQMCGKRSSGWHIFIPGDLLGVWNFYVNFCKVSVHKFCCLN